MIYEANASSSACRLWRVHLVETSAPPQATSSNVAANGRGVKPGFNDSMIVSACSSRSEPQTSPQHFQLSLTTAATVKKTRLELLPAALVPPQFFCFFRGSHQ
jgi:hypothetical protein